MIIIRKNKGYLTRMDCPDSYFPVLRQGGTPYTKEELFLVPDMSELAKKVSLFYPNYDFVLDKCGQLLDVEKIEKE